MRIVATATVIALTATPLAAGTWKTQCGAKSVPYQVSVNDARPEEILGGAIIGGVVGKAVTGENAGAVVGAVIGGAVASESNKKTVTRYKDVNSCRQVFIPEQIDDQDALTENILLLNGGGSLNRDRIRDVQFSIGAHHDGVWGPRSARAGDAYLASNAVAVSTKSTEGPLYLLIVNEVVIVSSPDMDEVDDFQTALSEAGVESQIVVELD